LFYVSFAGLSLGTAGLDYNTAFRLFSRALILKVVCGLSTSLRYDTMRYTYVRSNADDMASLV